VKTTIFTHLRNLLLPVFNLHRAYCKGYGNHPSTKHIKNNPYNPNTEKLMYDAYEAGYVDGSITS